MEYILDSELFVSRSLRIQTVWNPNYGCQVLDDEKLQENFARTREWTFAYQFRQFYRIINFSIHKESSASVAVELQCVWNSMKNRFRPFRSSQLSMMLISLTPFDSIVLTIVLTPYDQYHWLGGHLAGYHPMGKWWCYLIPTTIPPTVHAFSSIVVLSLLAARPADSMHSGHTLRTS